MKGSKWAVASLATAGSCLALAACGSSSSSNSGSGSSAGSTGSASSGSAIPVTFDGDLTGDVGFVGKQVLNGMNIAVKQANSSGELKGKKIVLTTMDNASEQANATTQVSQIVHSGAVALFGPLLSNEALATAPIAESAKIVDIETEAESAGLLSTGEYIYRVTPSEERYDPLTFDHLAKLGAKSMNVLYASDNPTLTEEATKDIPAWCKTLGISIGSSVGAPSTTTDYASIATKLMSGNPSAIALYNIGAGIATVVTALRNAGYKGYIVADQSATAGSLTSSGSAANGVMYSVQYSPSLPYKASAEFAKLFTQTYPGQAATGYSATGYDAMRLFIDAIEKSGDSSRSGVLKGMQAVTAAGSLSDAASGPLKFIAPDNRDVTAGGALVEWENGKEKMILSGTPGVLTQPVKPL